MQGESMNAIDVMFQTEVNIENKTAEQLTAEINNQYYQAEQFASMSAIMLAEAGKRLLEVKGRIPHGEFGEWCKNNLTFSYRKAARMMQLAEKMEDENSPFSKMPTLATIGISRVWELLSAPEEVAAEVIETGDVESMTVRELKEEISRLKNEKAVVENNNDDIRKELARAQRELADAVTEEDYSRMQNEYVEAQKDLESELREAKDASAEIQAKLDKAKEDLKKEKQKRKDLETAKDEEVTKRLEEASVELTNKAKEEAFAESEAEIRKHIENIESLEEQVKQLEAEKSKLSNTNIMTFKVLTDELQDILEKIDGVIDDQNEKDPEVGAKMVAGLKAIAERWIP